MTRQLTAICFLLAFASQTFNRSFILLDYYANTASFAKNCENKARPKLQCNGKCQAMKKMQEQEKKDQKNPERRAETKTEVLYSNAFFCSISPFTAALIKPTPHSLNSQPVKMARVIFHPPGV